MTTPGDTDPSLSLSELDSALRQLTDRYGLELTPGELLQAEIDRRHIRHADVGRSCGVSRTTVWNWCSDHRGMSEFVALKLEKALGIPAEVWIWLQLTADLRKARAEQLKHPELPPLAKHTRRRTGSLFAGHVASKPHHILK